ncbi:hypothetical protein [Corynebacterium epidermidicanis]|nr:hypothetical protein [Corynebacterium epidermidicanis]
MTRARAEILKFDSPYPLTYQEEAFIVGSYIKVAVEPKAIYPAICYVDTAVLVIYQDGTTDFASGKLPT